MADEKSPDYSGETIYLTQISDRGKPIEDVVFEDCRIIGPAVVGLDDCRFEGAGFWGDVEGAMWPMPTGRYVQGLLIARRCLFRNCTFQGIGFTGRNLDAIREQMQTFFTGTWPGSGA
jgi:hypothetical protein